MTKDEAIEKLQDILDEATAYENAVCYVTSVDKEPLTMAIEALKTEAIPVTYIQDMINELKKADMCEFAGYLKLLITYWKGDEGRNETA